MSGTAAEPGRPAPATTAAPRADEAEAAAVLERAGYKPELRRSLRFFSMFAIAFSIISITTGIFLNYGFGLAYWGPAAIWTWPIIGVCNMMIALVVAELGTRIPLAGYAYQWSARLVNPTYGWFVGFAGLLYMAVGGGAIMLEVASPLLLSEFNVDTPSPQLVLTVAIILMLLPVVINIISIQVAARVNNVAVFTEIIGTVVFGVLLLVLWGVHAKPTAYGATPIIALLVFGVIDLGVMIYGYNQPSAFGTLVGATAIIPYIIYFLITLAYALKRRTLDSLPGAFNLGRWAWPVIGFVLVYTVVVMLVLSLPAPFHGSDKVLGYGLALAALWYFGGLLWRLKKGTAGVRPVEDLAGPKQDR
jgi:amino acid transporter